MINLTSSGGTITFAFDNNSGYLQNGTIEVPVNSLSLVIDESDMVTFKKANSNDVFVSALASDFGMSKAQLISFYKDNMVENISDKADYSAATINIEEETTTSGEDAGGYVNKSFNYSDNVYYFSAFCEMLGDRFWKTDVTLSDGEGNTVSTNMSTSAGETDTYILVKPNNKNFTITAKGNYRITAVTFESENGRTIVYEYKTKILVEKAVSTVITDEIEPALSAKADTSAVTESINAAVSGKADYSAATVNISEDVTTTGRSRYEQFNIDYSNNVYYISASFDEGIEGYDVVLKDSPSGNTIVVSNSTSAGETDSYIFTKDSSSFELTTKGSYKITRVALLPESDYVNYTYIASNNVEKAVSTAITDDIFPYLASLEARVKALEDAQNNS